MKGYSVGNCAAAIGRGPAFSALAPALIDPETLSWPDSPQTISAGGTYTGLRIEAADGQSCLTIQTADEVTLVDCDFYGGTGSLIHYLWGASKLTVENCRFFGRVPATAGERNGRAVDIQFGTKLHFRNNYVQGTMGVYVGTFETGFDTDIRYNVFRNIDGRASDGAGDRDNDVANWFRCQAVQFNGANGMKLVTAGSTIAWNEAWNPFDEAWAEDTFSLTAISGTSTNPFVVERNLVSRSARVPSTTTAQFSGGGILIEGGGNTAGEYIILRDNVIVEATNYGIAIAGGAYNTAEGNLILRSGFNDLNQALSDWDNGIYVRDYSSTDVGRYGNHSLINNDIGWQMASGTFYNLSIDQAGPNLTNTGNTLRSATVTKADIDAAVIAWRAAAATAGHTIGATRA